METAPEIVAGKGEEKQEHPKNEAEKALKFPEERGGLVGIKFKETENAEQIFKDKVEDYEETGLWMKKVVPGKTLEIKPKNGRKGEEEIGDGENMVVFRDGGLEEGTEQQQKGKQKQPVGSGIPKKAPGYSDGWQDGDCGEEEGKIAAGGDVLGEIRRRKTVRLNAEIKKEEENSASAPGVH